MPKTKHGSNTLVARCNTREYGYENVLKMGRNNKISLQYFPVDATILHDTKIRRLTRKYPRGVEFYIYLLSAIYSDKGYYLPVDEETVFDIADDMRMEEAEVAEMMDFCLDEKIGLFERKLRDRHGILTSRGIQKRYLETMRQLKRKVTIDPEFLLVDDEQHADSDDLKPAKPEDKLAFIRNIGEEKGISSEEMPIYSEETGDYSENKAISSDRNKREEKKEKESKVKEREGEEKTHAPTRSPEEEIFEKFKKWSECYAPASLLFAEPLTLEQFLWLHRRYGAAKLKQTASDLHNKEAHKQNRNAMNAWKRWIEFVK